MNTSIDLSVILVSHNTKELILQAIQSIYDTTKKVNFEVIVVENASGDGSAEVIEKQFSKVKIVRTKMLVGFAEANNFGRAEAKGEYLFFLNPDTEAQDGAIDTLLESMRREQIRVASGQLQNPDHTIQPQGGALPNLWKVKAWMFFIDDLPLINSLFTPYQQRNPQFFKTYHHNVGWIGGTALMIEAKLFDAVGGWDSRIFLYAEDVELCLRLHKHRANIALFPDAKILHKRHGSVGSSKTSFIGEIEGLIYIWKKHHPAWQLPLLRLVLWMGSWLRVLVFGILLGDENRKAAYLEAQKRARMA